METEPRINYKTDRATDNYIKMCKKAKEIQKLRHYNEGGWFYTKHGYHRISDDFIYFITDVQVTDNWITRINGIWLPMQEQLQEILYNYYQCNKDIRGLQWGQQISRFMIQRFSDFVIEDKEIAFDFNSLWIKFLYKEIYNKTWTGKDWVIIGTTNKANQKK